MIDLLLKNARMPEGDEWIDLAVDGGLIIENGRALQLPARRVFDLQGRLLLPGFIDPHVHLDIALINDCLTPGRTTAYRSQKGMLEDLNHRRAAFTGEDIEQRALAALDMASRHGVTALRAQCHVDSVVQLKHLEALLKVKERYAGRITLQIVAFPHLGFFDHPSTLELFRQAVSLGADAIGCASNHDQDPRAHLETALDLAVELGVDLDMHADLSLPDMVEFEALDIVIMARRVIERSYQGRVIAAHLNALDSAAPDLQRQVIELVHEAQISVVSLPDLYRLGRLDAQRVRRGLMPVKKMLAAGVNITYGSNNVRDALRPFGNLDPLEEALILAYGAHMDEVEELEALVEMSTYNAAKALRLADYGLQPGCRADLVVIEASSPSAAIVDQAEKAFVFKAGRLIYANRLVSERYP